MIRLLLVIFTVAAALSGPAPQAAAQTGDCGLSTPECALKVVAAAATLDRGAVPAGADSDALLDVQAAGRFMLRAQSKTGVAIQLVDMMAGPGERAGDAGARDGRLDLLLDKGVYKLRVFGAEGAGGEAKLSVEPLREVDATAPALPAKARIATTLSDLQQRSYWIAVEKPGRIWIEAAGRALQDLRLWHNGRDLAALTPEAATVEPKPGHAMTRLRLDGVVEPGVYRVTAYGGEPLPWADGDKAEPLHLRSGEPGSLASGLVDGIIGPLGSARFQIPPEMTAFRLELPEAAPAKLIVTRGGGSQTGAITRKSREPVVTLTVPPSGAAPAFAEVAGLEGQAFRLRALRPATGLRIDQGGLYHVSVDVAGEGGDELPATVVLARYETGKPTVVLASSGPRLSPGQAWRARFNLRGTSTLLFEVTGAGPVALTSEGPGLRATIRALTHDTAPRADGRNPRLWDLEAGWYLLSLEPIDGAAGIVDMTLGQPGLKPDIAAPAPSRTTIPLGMHELGKPAYYQLFANSTPGLLIGPKARALPADLAAAPLTLMQTPDQPMPAAPPLPRRANAAPARANPAAPAPKEVKGVPPFPVPKPVDASPALAAPTGAADNRASGGPLDLPIRAPAEGTIVAAETDGTPVPITILNEVIAGNQRNATVRIAPTPKPRAIVLSWSAPAAPPPPVLPEPESATPLLEPGKPRFFDLQADERRSFRLDLAEGGLYRIETLGRLKTAATIGSAFLPKIAEASDNGDGRNARLQAYLRAGSYRLGVSASESSGHLGVASRPAELRQADPIVAGETARASLDEGRGAVFPMSVTEAGVYRLDLFGLDRTFTARIEDGDGWPITAPGAFTGLEQRFQAGRYRLVVLPEDVDARAVARLQRIVEAKPAEGHGPHPLPFDAVQQHQWREPAEKDGARQPDRWEFALEGPAHVALDIGDGMIANLLKQDADAPPLARIAHKRGYSGLLPAGRYAVEARSLGRNDRLDYELTLRTDEIQPGVSRRVDLPATVPFAIAEDRVVNLTTLGRTGLRAVLKDGEDRIVERLSGRLNDWNIALSRLLPAGAYKLELTASAGADQPADLDTPPAPDEDGETADTDARRIELHLALPEAVSAADLALAGTQTLTGPWVHRLTLPPAEPGQLLVVAAQSGSEIVLSLERRSGNGMWVPGGSARGIAPILSVPGDGDAGRPWRVSAWAVDGGAASITLTARAAAPQAQALGAVKLNPVPLDGLATPLRLALIDTPAAGLLSLEGASATLSQGSSPGRVLAATEDGLLSSQSAQLWLVSQDADAQAVTVKAIPAISGDIAIGLAAGDKATLPRSLPAAGQVRVWRAESALAQPGLEAGAGMGVAQGSTIAFARDAPVSAWNAGSGDAFRFRLAGLDIAMTAGALNGGRFAGVLRPMSGLRIALPEGEAQIALDLAEGVAAHLAGGANATVWSGLAPTSRRLDGRWSEVLLVNLSAKPAPAVLSVASTDPTGALTAGNTVKRFFGAAGAFSVRAEATADDKLVVVGGKATFLADNGQVSRGESLSLPGSGQATIEHGAGLVAAWIEGPGKSPWAAAEPVTASLPQDVKLEGQAMRFALHQEQPALLHVTSTAPVILMLSQDGRQQGPALFANGAEFHRYLAAGTAELRAFSPHDGPLAGTLRMAATPVVRIGEGLGEPMALAPGQTALFAFDVTRAAEIGAGLRADPDHAAVRLLDERGNPLGEGVTQFRRLQPGRYLLEARIPPDGSTTIIRPAVVGIAPPPAGPPPAIMQHYLELVGITPPRAQ